MQRFISSCSILIFEINDLVNDEPHLQTVCKQIGVKRNKSSRIGLLTISFSFRIFKKYLETNHSEFYFSIVVSLFLIFANENRSKYYTSFGLKVIPVFLVVNGCLN
jgi:hypothetical protein